MFSVYQSLTKGQGTRPSARHHPPLSPNSSMRTHLAYSKLVSMERTRVLAATIPRVRKTGSVPLNRDKKTAELSWMALFAVRAVGCLINRVE